MPISTSAACVEAKRSDTYCRRSSSSPKKAATNARSSSAFLIIFRPEAKRPPRFAKWAWAHRDQANRSSTMSKASGPPWHQIVRLRDDLRTGELALNEFAADLYDVALQSGRRRIYEDP